MYCEKCKKLYTEGQYCVTCGNKLEETAEKKSVKIPIMLAVISFLLTSIFLIKGIFFSDGPSFMSGFILLILPVIILMLNWPFLCVVGIYIDKKNAKTKKAQKKSSGLVICIYIISILQMIFIWGIKDVLLMFMHLIGITIAFLECINNK